MPAVAEIINHINVILARETKEKKAQNEQCKYNTI